MIGSWHSGRHQGGTWDTGGSRSGYRSLVAIVGAALLAVGPVTG